MILSITINIRDITLNIETIENKFVCFNARSIYFQNASFIFILRCFRIVTKQRLLTNH